MRILFVTPFVPSRERPSPFHHIRYLSRSHEVFLVCLQHDEREKRYLSDLAPLCGIRAVPCSSSAALLRCATKLASPTPLFAAYCQDPSFKRAVEETLSAEPFDLLHVQHLRGCWAALGTSDLPKTYDSQDCFSLLMRRLSESSPHPLWKLLYWTESLKMPAFEREVLRGFDAVTCCSPVDQAELQRMAPDRPVHYLPNGVDLNHFKPCPARDRAEDRVLFVGRLSYLPNRDALEYLLDRILPVVRSRRPSLRFRVVGGGISKKLERRLRSLSWVEFAGHSDDVRLHHQWSSVSLAPMRLGVGTNFKIIEAMASGLPVVTTPKGCEGLRLEAGRDLLVGGDSKELAEAILSLLENPQRRQELGRAARSYVEREHDWDKIGRRLEEIQLDAVSRKSN